MLEFLQQWLQPYIDMVSPYVSDTLGVFSDYKFLQAAFVAAVGYLFARLLARHTPDLFVRIAQRLSLKVDHDVVALTRFPLFNLTFLGGLIAAVQVSGLNDELTFVLRGVLKSTIIAVIALFVYRLARLLLEHIAHRGSAQTGIIQPQTLPLFTNVVMVFVLVGAAHQTFAVWNVDMTALLASAGIAGLAIGMASQNMLADVIAGILILADRPYRLNDIIWLNEDDNTIKGRVLSIGMRSTRILTIDNLEIIVPNAVMAQAKIMNETSSQAHGLRVGLEISTASGVDSEQIRSLLLEEAQHSPRVLQNKPQEVYLLRFDDQLATFNLTFWIEDTVHQEEISANLRESIYCRLLKDDIPLGHPVQEIAITDLPESRQEIRIKEMPDSNRTIFVKEMPYLFGTPAAKQMERISSNKKPTPAKPAAEEVSS